MVLHRDKTVAIWGWADPGEAVEVKLAQQTVTAQADKRGAWKVTLEAMAAAVPTSCGCMDSMQAGGTREAIGKVTVAARFEANANRKKQEKV